MKGNSKALINFTKARVSGAWLYTFTNIVITCMKDNPHFPGIAAYLDPLIVKFEEFNDVYFVALDGSASQKQVARDTKAEMQQLLKALCTYVNVVSNGNRPALLTTGFKISKETRSRVVLSEVEEFSLTYGQSRGEMIASFKKQKGMTGILFQYSYDEVFNEDTNWKTISSSKRSCIIKGLIPGKNVTVRVVISGAREQSIYSKMITKVVGCGL